MRTPSNMLSLGTQAPAFSLPDTQGRMIDLEQAVKENGLLVAFICNHCPYVLHVIDEFVSLANRALEQGVGVVAISANDVENYSDDSPENMKRFARQYGFQFPYLYDESQQVALAYQAACTPDFYLFNGEKALVYRGQFDASRPGNGVEVTGEALAAAVSALLNGESPSDNQTPSVGCNIKWKADRVPEYFPPKP